MASGELGARRGLPVHLLSLEDAYAGFILADGTPHRLRVDGAMFEFIPDLDPSGSLAFLFDSLVGISLPFRKRVDPATGDEVAVRTSELVLHCRDVDDIWIAAMDNDARGEVLELLYRGHQAHQARVAAVAQEQAARTAP